MLGTFIHVFKRQGILGLYNGLSAALFRQLTYSTVRFAVYEELKSRYRQSPSTLPSSASSSSSSSSAPQKTPQTPLLQLILMSSAAGLLGGLAGNPGDVLNVRMQSDFGKPPAERRNYRHALDGLIRMIKEEGPSSLVRGIWPNSARAVLMTSSQLASYDTFKQTMLHTFHMPSDHVATHFLSSLAASFVATTVCSPVDVVKTRVMSAARASGSGAGVSVLSLIRETTKVEGAAWMFRGWVPSFIRLGPQTIATMVFFEQHKILYRKWHDS